MYVAIAVIAIIVILVLWVIGSYNGLIKLKNMVEEAFSTMDVYLQKRHDLIPNIVNTVKGYAKHESETLEKVIAARNQAATASTNEEKIQAEANLQGSLRGLFAVAENYPDLKANANFLDLQNKLTSVENDIANSRKYYNGVVKKFNTKIQVVPTNIIANIFHFEKQPLFTVNDDEDRKNVNVQF
ncbi:MAG: LemA family protein [Ruminococcus sp.]|nr:LemA family protein [Candidatus Copronaster equi]